MTLFYFSGKRENGDVLPGSYKTYDSEKHFKYCSDYVDDDRYNLIEFYDTWQLLIYNKYWQVTLPGNLGYDFFFRSWWYKFCVKCRGEDESLPSWEPRAWPKFCPYPFCPTYRQFSRIICLVLIGFLSWCAIYSIVGKRDVYRKRVGFAPIVFF